MTNMNLYRNIKRLKVENFRVFKDEIEFEFSPFTILTGTNNSGKSALQKLLFLIKSTYLFDKKNSTLDNLMFTSKVIEQIDFFENNLNYKGIADDLKLSFVIEDSLCDDLSINLFYEKSKIDQNGVLKSISLNAEHEEILIFKSPITNSETLTWSCEVPESGVGKMYELLLEEKKKIIEKSEILIIFNKLSNKDSLTTDDTLIKKRLESKGYLFFDERANSEVDMNESVSMDGIYAINVWDENTNSAFYINNELEKDWEHYYDKDYKILIPSLLSNMVFSEVDFFNNSFENENEIKNVIRNLLIKNEIFTVADFLKYYISFEQTLICAFINNELPTGDEGLGGPDSTRRFSFRDFFSVSGKTDEYILGNFIRQVVDFNPIARVLTCSEYESCFPKLVEQETSNTDFLSKLFKSPDKKPKNYIEDFNNMVSLLDKYHNKTRTLIRSLDFNLSQLAENYIFVSTRTVIKNFYFFTDSNIEDHAFIHFGNMVLSKSSEVKKKIDFCNKWLMEFNIASSVEVEPIILDRKTIGLSYFLKNKKSKHLIGDNGMGVKMIVSMIISMVLKEFSFQDKIIHLEEPEVHLHPAYQSKLTELFVDAYKTFKHRFIIETHSEYLIRKFQVLVAQSDHKINADDVTIYYFNDLGITKDQKNILKRIHIKDDGVLNEDFGLGFFDEADNLAFELMKLRYIKKN